MECLLNIKNTLNYLMLADNEPIANIKNFFNKYNFINSEDELYKN